MDFEIIRNNEYESHSGLGTCILGEHCVEINYSILYVSKNSRGGKKKVRDYGLYHPTRGQFYFSTKRLDDTLLLLDGSEDTHSSGEPLDYKPKIFGAEKSPRRAEKRLHQRALERAKELVKADIKDGKSTLPIIDRTTLLGRLFSKRIYSA